MNRWLSLTRLPIDEDALIKSRTPSARSGAVIVFIGVVRSVENGETIQGIDYEAFERMAEHQFHRLFGEMETRWPVESIRVIHRIGRVASGEPSLWVEVLAPHRGEAFAATQWLIDEMKRVVPIWKHPF